MHSHPSQATVATLLTLALAMSLGAPALADEIDPQTPVVVPPPGSDAVAPGEVEAPDESAVFAPPPIGEDEEFDWIRFSSGEWLKGNIEYMKDGDLEFDSAELDDLVVDFPDITEMRSPKPNTYVFEDKLVVTGPALMKGDEIAISAGGAPQTYERAKLLRILEGTPRERNYWSGGVGFGLTARKGNTDSLDISANGWLKRESASTRLNLSYLGAFGTLSGEQNTNNHRINERFDWFITRRFFAIPIMFDFYNDKFQNIKYRITPAAGVGYEVYNRRSIEWDVLAGFGYQLTRFKTVPSGSKKSEGTAVAVLGTTFGADITQYLEFDFLYRLNLGIPDVKKTNHHAESVFSFDVWGPLDFDVTFVFDRVEDPAELADGTTPKKNDFRLIVGLGVDF